MGRLSSFVISALAPALVAGALGCSGAFHRAMERGDAYAGQGNWEAAAASYDAARQLDPDSVEAYTKWMNARRWQASSRLAASRGHLARGELALAAQTARAAMTLDPQNTEAKAQYAEARSQLLARAEELIKEEKLEQALELAQALRQIDPNDRPAVDLEGRCLDLIAARAYDRAEAYVAQKKWGNALLAFNEAERARRGYRDARARAAELRAQIEDEIRFLLQIERAPEAARNGLTTRVEDGLLAWEPEPRFRLSAASERPPPPGAQAVRLAARLSVPERAHEISTVARSCDYVCGVDRVPNSEHAAATRRADEATARARAAERREAQARRQVQSAKTALTAATNTLAAAETKLNAARAKQSACSSTKKPGETCASEDAKVDAAERDQRAAADRESDARQSLSQEERELSDAEAEVSSARAASDRALRELSATPSTVLVDRICTHNYGVEIHTFFASTTLRLTAQVFGDPEPVDLPPKPLRLSVQDEAFPPFPGRCAEVAAGDPLSAPTDAGLEVALAKRAVDDIRDQVAGWYGPYVDAYRKDESTARAAGRIEDANEAYIRHRLLGPGLAW